MVSEAQCLLNSPQYQLTSDDKGFLKQWSINRQTLIRNFGQVTKNGIYAMAKTHDQKYLLIGSGKGLIIQYCLKEMILVKEYPIFKYKITSIAITHDNQSIFCSDSRGNLTQLSLKDGLLEIEKEHRKAHKVQINCITISSDDKFMATGCGQGFIKLWSLLEKKWISGVSQQSSSNIIMDMKFCKAGNSLYSMDMQGTVYLYNQINFEIVEKEYETKISDGVKSLEISNLDEYFFVSGTKGKLDRIDTGDNSIQHFKKLGKYAFDNHYVDPPRQYNYDVSSLYCMKLSSDNQYLFTGDCDGSVKFWDVSEMKEINKLLNAHESSIHCMVIIDFA